MNTVILFIIVLFNGQTLASWSHYDTMEQCEKARAIATTQALEAGITDGSFVCTLHKVGKLA